eukprot:1150034-Pelagomonas_calceolata.AAC.2
MVRTGAQISHGPFGRFTQYNTSNLQSPPPMTEANSADGPYAVVLAPTRELAQQIEEETIKLAHYTK